MVTFNPRRLLLSHSGPESISQTADHLVSGVKSVLVVIHLEVAVVEVNDYRIFSLVPETADSFWSVLHEVVEVRHASEVIIAFGSFFYRVYVPDQNKENISQMFIMDQSPHAYNRLCLPISCNDSIFNNAVKIF